MNITFVAFLTAALSLLAFIVIWIRVGVYKGSTDERLKNVEQKNTELATRVETIREEKHTFEKQIGEFMAEMRTNIKFIFEGITDLKKKQEKQENQDA